MLAGSLKFCITYKTCVALGLLWLVDKITSSPTIRLYVLFWFDGVNHVLELSFFDKLHSTLSLPGKKLI